MRVSTRAILLCSVLLPGLATTPCAGAAADLTAPDAVLHPDAGPIPAPPAPLLLAISQMLVEAQQREAAALARAIAAEQRNAVLETEVQALRHDTSSAR